MELNFDIAGVKIRFKSKYKFSDGEFSDLFLSQKSEPCSVVEFEKAEAFPEMCGNAVKHIGYDVYVSGNSELISYNDISTGKTRYLYEKADGANRVYFSDESQLRTDYLWSFVDFPGIMLENQRLFFHCSFIKYKNSAILFCGKSGSGKSTQAQLWEDCEGAEQINGDKALLYFKNGTLYASSLPICGTSGICKNEEAPVKAIFSLKKGQENTVTKLEGVSALTEIFSNTVFNSWRDGEAVKCIDLASKVITSVPVFSYCCLPDRSAVEKLLTVL